MSETAGWMPGELPASREARELSEILSADPTFAEREAGRHAQAAAKEQRDLARDAADSAETDVWKIRLRGGEIPDVPGVLARAGSAWDGDGSRERRRQAREILRAHGLEDVITGGSSGVILDANLGVLEREPGTAERAQPGIDRETRRSLEAAEAGRAYVESISRSRRPFASRSRGSHAVRSEYCVHCTDQGVSDQDSYLLHSDPELNVPVTPPGTQAEADRRQAEADRLIALGYTAETARLASYGAGMAVR